MLHDRHRCIRFVKEKKRKKKKKFARHRKLSSAQNTTVTEINNSITDGEFKMRRPIDDVEGMWNNI